jgi:hypothetical protein
MNGRLKAVGIQNYTNSISKTYSKCRSRGATWKISPRFVNMAFWLSLNSIQKSKSLKAKKPLLRDGGTP